MATFQLEYMLSCGDIESNPDLTRGDDICATRQKTNGVLTGRAVTHTNTVRSAVTQFSYFTRMLIVCKKSRKNAMLMRDLRAQVVFLTETKIDEFYPNSQFSVKGYNMYLKDRKKGGGGIMAYFASSLPF